MKHLLLALAALAPPAAAQVSPERLSADVRTLASDAFEGRAPGTAGEAKTVAWLIARMKALKLAPGGPNGSWTQDVPLVRTQLGEGAARAIQRGIRRITGSDDHPNFDLLLQ